MHDNQGCTYTIIDKILSRFSMRVQGDLKIDWIKATATLTLFTLDILSNNFWISVNSFVGGKVNVVVFVITLPRDEGTARTSI